MANSLGLQEGGGGGERGGPPPVGKAARMVHVCFDDNHDPDCSLLPLCFRVFKLVFSK